MRSGYAKDLGDLPAEDLSGGPLRREEGADQGETRNLDYLLPGEEDLHLGVEEHALLHGHRVADRHADDHAQQARRENQNKRLVEVEQFYAIRGEAHGA